MSDWHLLLAALVHEADHDAFEWGRHDCCTFAADAVFALTGRDPMADLRGRWSNARQALEVLRRLGGLAAATTARLGPALPMPQLAQRGDIVMVPNDTHASMPHALAVCLGDVAVGPAADGLGRVHMFNADGSTPVIQAWRV